MGRSEQPGPGQNSPIRRRPHQKGSELFSYAGNGSPHLHDWGIHRKNAPDRKQSPPVGETRSCVPAQRCLAAGVEDYPSTFQNPPETQRRQIAKRPRRDPIVPGQIYGATLSRPPFSKKFQDSWKSAENAPLVREFWMVRGTIRAWSSVRFARQTARRQYCSARKMLCGAELRG